jgi:hypothetical protein
MLTSGRRSISKEQKLSAEYGTTRWWENYLVRYLMPSIAGVVIVSWLCSHGGDGLRELLFLPPSVKPMPANPSLQPRLDTISLVLLFLYGNLFCYIASYPVLVFHVTRVIDFADGKWLAKFYDGYLAVIVLLVLAFSIFHLSAAEYRYWLALVFAVLMAAVQFKRLHIASSLNVVDLPGLSKGTVSKAYGFAFTLAKRRGVEEIRTTNSSASVANESSALNDDDEDEVKNQRQIAWRQELISTYRHMREHGNSAFIFLLELALAALVYCVITKPGQTAPQQLGATAALFAIWAAPSVFVHLLGQHLERRFSKFDNKVGRTIPQTANATSSNKA